MLEREAMAILVSALPMRYSRRAAALKQAGSALGVIADPYAFADRLTQDGAAAVQRAVRESERILEGIYDAGVHLIVLGEEGYPQLLAQIPHPPHLLFVQGNADLTDALKAAVVGTRRASEYGLRHTRRMAAELAGAGVCIVSGIALGIDAAAHEGALDVRGRTIAVLGSALDRFYPPENRGLRDRILDVGGSVISEYPMGTSHTRYSFLERNRIIAGLSMGVLVTDGPQRSGALRTANDAADYGREVFALPGSVDAPGSQLPHKLIAEGAHLVTCGADVLCVLAPQLAQQIRAEKKQEEPKRKTKSAAKKETPREEAPKQAVMPIPEGIGSEERAVLEALAAGEKEFDELSEETAIDAMTLGAVLMGLEMDGLIDALPGLRYARRA